MKVNKWTVGGGIIGLGILTFVGLTVRKKIRTEKASKLVSKAASSQNQKLLGINVPEIAKQIGFDLGTAFPSYDPRRWTENDDAVRILVLKVPKPVIPQLIDSYRKQYNRNLQDDLQKMLDNYDTVSYLFK